MSERDQTSIPEGGFFRRWSERKLEATEEQTLPAEAETVVQPEIPPPGDEDMPPLETLTEESDFSGFLSPNVSEELRQVALRKLFMGAVFNRTDGLDDYDDDFTTFEKLGDIITSDMRHQMEMMEEKKKALKEEEKGDDQQTAGSEETADVTQSASSVTDETPEAGTQEVSEQPSNASNPREENDE